MNKLASILLGHIICNIIWERGLLHLVGNNFVPEIIIEFFLKYNMSSYNKSKSCKELNI